MFGNETKYKLWCIAYSIFSIKLEQSFITSHEWNQKYESCVCVHSHFRNRISRYNKQYDIFDSQIKRNVTYLSRYLQHELHVLARRNHSILVILDTKYTFYFVPNQFVLVSLFEIFFVSTWRTVQIIHTNDLMLRLLFQYVSGNVKCFIAFSICSSFWINWSGSVWSIFIVRNTVDLQP